MPEPGQRADGDDVHRGAVDGYLDEVERARRDACQRTDEALAAGAPAVTLGLEFRYALVAASVAALDSHLSDALTAKATAPSPAAGPSGEAAGPSREPYPAVPADELERARRTRGRQARLRALTALLPRLGADPRAGVLEEVLDEAVALARGFGGVLERADALAGLAPYLSAGLLAEVLSLTARMNQTYHADAAGAVLSKRARLLPAERLAAELLPAVRAAARTMRAPYELAETLTGLARRLPPQQQAEVVPEALAAARRVDGPAGAQALAAVVPLLPPEDRTGVVGEALAGLRGASWWLEVKEYPDALTMLAPHLSSGQVDDAMDLIHRLGREDLRAHVLTRMASRLPVTVLPALLSRAGQLLDRRLRAEVVAAALDRMPPEARAAAIGTARAYHDEGHRATALAALAAHLPAEQRTTLLTGVFTGAGPVTGPRAFAWSAPELLAYLPAAACAEMADAVRTLPDPYQRAWALTHLAPHVPVEHRRDVQAQALTTAHGIDDDCDHVPDIVRALAPLLPSDLLRTTLAMDWSVDTADVLVGLAPHLPADLHERAFDIARTRYLRGDWERARVLAALAPHLPHARLSTAIAEARRISDPSARARAFGALARRLAENLVAELHTAARAESVPRDRADLTIPLLPFLPADARQKAAADALNDVRAESDPTARATHLAQLASALPAPLRAEAIDDLLVTIREPRKPGSGHPPSPTGRWLPDRRFLEGLLSPLPPGDRPAVAAAVLSNVDGLPAGWLRVESMLTLAPYLPADRYPGILASVTALADGHRRGAALERLAPLLPAALLADALAVARGTMTGFERAVTALLHRAHRLWRDEPAVPLVALIRQALHDADRPRCLTVAAASADAINDLGGAGAVAECIDAIAAVGRWWP